MPAIPDDSETSLTLSASSGLGPAWKPARPIAESMWGHGWCCRWVSNLRPLPYQGSALPLSYGSARSADRPNANSSQYTRCTKLARSGDRAAVDRSYLPCIVLLKAGLAPALNRLGGKRFSLYSMFTATRKSPISNHELLDRFRGAFVASRDERASPYHPEKERRARCARSGWPRRCATICGGARSKRARRSGGRFRNRRRRRRRRAAGLSGAPRSPVKAAAMAVGRQLTA